MNSRRFTACGALIREVPISSRSSGCAGGTVYRESEPCGFEAGDPTAAGRVRRAFPGVGPAQNRSNTRSGATSMLRLFLTSSKETISPPVRPESCVLLRSRAPEPSRKLSATLFLRLSPDRRTAPTFRRRIMVAMSKVGEKGSSASFSVATGCQPVVGAHLKRPSSAHRECMARCVSEDPSLAYASGHTFLRHT